MASKQQRMWTEAAGEAAAVLNGHVEGGRRPRLTASLDGFEVEIRLVAAGAEDHRVRNLFQVSLPGWPTEAGLTLRSNWPRPVLRGRYIRFDDPGWDDRFKVKAKDRDTVKIQLTRERRAAIIEWFESHIHDDGLLGPVIEKGQFQAVSAREIVGRGDAGEMVRHVQSLVEFGRIITR